MSDMTEKEAEDKLVGRIVYVSSVDWNEIILVVDGEDIRVPASWGYEE